MGFLPISGSSPFSQPTLKSVLLVLLWLMGLSIGLINAQTDSIVRLDDSLALQKKPKTKTPPSVRRALVFALVIPGGGQIYNRRFWKLPIVYGGLAGLGYWFTDQYRGYRVYTATLDSMVRNGPLPVIPDRYQLGLPNLTMSDVEVARRQYRSNYERAGLLLGLFYGLTVMDAFVDAHLRSFDVSDDLSLSIRPRMQMQPGSGTVLSPGLSVQLRSRPPAKWQPSQALF